MGVLKPLYDTIQRHSTICYLSPVELARKVVFLTRFPSDQQQLRLADPRYCGTIVSRCAGLTSISPFAGFASYVLEAGAIYSRQNALIWDE